MLGTESGKRTPRKKRNGPAPSMRAASHSSSGTVVPNLYCQNAAVAERRCRARLVASLLRAEIGALIGEVEAAPLPPADTPVFTPNLPGERTPHDDSSLTGPSRV